MGFVARKPDFVVCEQQRRRKAYTFMQSDQHFLLLVASMANSVDPDQTAPRGAV